jgi:hypothetical protein
MQSPSPAVTWIKVDEPRFDLWGVLVGSLSITGILAGAALVLGLSFGVWLILRRRRFERDGDAGLLRLDPARHP